MHEKDLIPKAETRAERGALLIILNQGLTVTGEVLQLDRGIETLEPGQASEIKT